MLRVQIPALPLPNWVTSRPSHGISGPQFPQLYRLDCSELFSSSSLWKHSGCRTAYVSPRRWRFDSRCGVPPSKLLVGGIQESCKPIQAIALLSAALCLNLRGLCQVVLPHCEPHECRNNWLSRIYPLVQQRHESSGANYSRFGLKAHSTGEKLTAASGNPANVLEHSQAPRGSLLLLFC